LFIINGLILFSKLAPDLQCGWANQLTGQIMHQNMSIVSPFMAPSRTGSGQQGSAALGALAGLFGLDSAGQDGGATFGQQLALVLKAAPGHHINGQHINVDGTSTMTMAGAAPSAEGSAMPLPLLQNGPMSGKGVMLAALKGGMNLSGLNSDLVASIRNQILTSAQNGEISLPPAWTNALERGAVIHPVFGEGAPDPAELTDIMAALGLIANGEMPLPAHKGSESADFGLGVAANHVPGAASEGASAPSSPGQPGLDNSTKAALNGALPGDNSDQDMALNGQTINGQAKSTQGATPATPADPALTAKAGVVLQGAANEVAASNTRSGDAANSANTSQAAGQNGAGNGTAASGNGSNTGSNGQGGDNSSASGTADNQNRAASPSNGVDRGGHPFLARLETMLEAHGLTVGSPLAQTAGLTGSENDALAPGMSGIQSGLNSNQAATPTTGTTQAMTSWSPVAGQVAVQISKQAREGTQEFTIRMDPPELGRVNVKLDIAHDGKVNAVISVDNEKTLHLLQRDQSQLERALADAGLQTDSGSLNFSMSGNDGSGKDTGMGAEGGLPNSSPLAAEATETEAGSTAADTLMVSDRPLDIKV
jgi:flagellar hook-length control protein FliK